MTEEDFVAQQTSLRHSAKGTVAVFLNLQQNFLQLKLGNFKK